MQIITRAHLLAFLTDPSMDPEQEFNVEMTAFVNAILTDSPDTQHYVYTDAENGDDVLVEFPDMAQPVKTTIVPDQDTVNGSYGASVSHTTWDPTRRNYYCYVGGCSLMSPAGFTLTTATFVG